MYRVSDIAKYLPPSLLLLLIFCPNFAMFTENESLLDDDIMMFFTVCLIVFDKISDYCRRQPRVIKRTLLLGT